jgi:hypothetical protein
MGVVLLRAFALVVLAAVTPATVNNQSGIELTLMTPEPRTYLVALDELELDWSDVHEREGRPDRTVQALSNVTTLSRLAEVLAEQQSANPGTRGRIVLYDPGKPRTAVNRRLLTSDVAVLLGEGMALADLTGVADIAQIRPVPGAPNAFVGRAASPLAAIEAARALAAVPGVKSAYPLVTRTPVSR